MPISIKNEATEQLARKLADLTGESLTDAIRGSLEERYERVSRSRGGKGRIEELTEIALRCSRRPILSDLSEDEILGYDEMGLPSK